MLEKPLTFCQNENWLLVLEDHFDSDSLDEGKWKKIKGVVRDPEYINSKQWFLEENVELSEGNLRIIAKNERVENACYDIWVKDRMVRNCSDFDYTTGEVESKWKFKYGYFESRIKIPKGMGFWSAFWAYGSGEKQGRYINNEIDVFEFWKGNSEKLNSTIHYDKKMCLQSFKGEDFSEDYHTYGLLWLPHMIAFYLDDELFRVDRRFYSLHGQTVGCDIKAWQTYIENEVFPKDPLAFIFGLGIDNRDKFRPNKETVFPGKLEVDWIRIYQPADCFTKSIDESDDFVLAEKTFNLVSGSNVEIDCDKTINSDEHLAIIAAKSVNIGGNLKFAKGSNVTIKTNPDYCNLNQKPNNLLQQVPKNGEMRAHDIYLPFTVYPNPSNGYFYIEPHGKGIHTYILEVYNRFGQLIIPPIIQNGGTLTIDLSGHSTGIYLLRMRETSSKEYFNFKLFRI